MRRMKKPKKKMKVYSCCNYVLSPFCVEPQSFSQTLKKKKKTTRVGKGRSEKKRKIRKTKKRTQYDLTKVPPSSEQGLEAQVEPPKTEQPAKLTAFQEKLRKILEELEKFHVGRCTIDPRKVQPPPPGIGIRDLIQFHLIDIKNHIEQTGASIGAKEMILVMCKVS